MENGQVPTYEEAFPPLASPTSLTAPASASAMFQGGNQSAWPVKSIPSSSVTQVRKRREREGGEREGEREGGRERERGRGRERERERERGREESTGVCEREGEGTSKLIHRCTCTCVRIDLISCLLVDSC